MASSRPPRLFLSPPDLSGRERALVSEAFDTNWIAPVGPHIDAFEKEFAHAVGAPAACALSSGTAGLHLALILAGIGPGAVVAVSTFTFVATANPVVYCGAVPVFVDSESTTWGMDPERLDALCSAQAAAGRPVRAVIAVHLYGNPARTDALLRVCARQGAVLIEDAAESLGSLRQGVASGTEGEFGVYSFNGNKIITTSGGGMLVARDPALVARAKFLSTQAKDAGGYYLHSQIGFNYRMSNVCAAIGRGQLEGLESKVERRRRVAARYEASLGGHGGAWLLPEPAGCRANRWLSTLVLPDGATRDLVVAQLELENIEARPVWKPLHEQKLYASNAYSGGSVASDLAARAVNLPSGSSLSEADQDRVVAVVRRVIG